MKHIRFLCMVVMLALVAFGCKKKESGPSQQTDVQKQVQPAKTTKPVEQAQPALADTENSTAETTTEPELIETDEDIDPDLSMQRAAAAGDVDKIQSLIAAGADVNAKAKNGASLLHIALIQGHEDVAALLISKGADIHATMTDGTTPLHFAVMRNCKEIVNFLLDDGADVNAMGTNLGSPLHIAANTGYVEIAEMLIAKGADVNIENQRGMTPLTFAKLKRNEVMLELLEKYGAE